MAKVKINFGCTECGHEEAKWMGRCPDCGSWNSFIEQKPIASGDLKSIRTKSKPVKSQALEDVHIESEQRINCGLGEVNRVLGGGIVVGSVILIGGEPGIGKSTLMMQVAQQFTKGNDKAVVLYVSGEESSRQLKIRAQRLSVQGAHIQLFCETSLEKCVSLFEKLNPSLVIVDSIQTMVSLEAGSIPGTVNQIKFCAYEMTSRCKEKDIPLFLTAHVTKGGQIAGPKVLEHMVDTVLYFEHGEGDIRILRSSKNRFGASGLL